MRLLVCAGGTGGGVYPALSIVQAAQEMDLLQELMWIGGQNGIEADLVPRAGIAFRPIPAAGVHGVGLRRLPGNLLSLARGARAASGLIRAFRPDVILFTGGYVAVPAAFAGRRVPSLLYVPDVEPGLALKALARFADRICLIAEDSRRFFPGRRNAVVTGHPVRKGLTNWTPEAARAALGLSADLPVLFVFGGSLGARSINLAVLAVLPELLADLQVVHLTGRLDWETVRGAADALPPEVRDRYHAFEYLHDEMGAAYTAADVVLCRAGASAVGELPLFGKPALVVPYPHAWRYQKVNADYLARSGAALMITDGTLNERLLSEIRDLVGDPARRRRMGAAMRALARPGAAEAIARELAGVAAGGHN
ncbi:MAG TPA: undecaprenyldiphospho-muramoylpentapeptide beta-N-acetylglucosaminyltransferase [Anaerolineales bacterium]|nr:undecaprenyldiphospho-muramoylpentapeptide beta-N-acetylglucosaminyltransferase [Anaerolineales bacterium]